MLIPVTATLAVPDDEIVETFVQASGPGGQNVNKVASAAQLRFDVARSPSLPDEVKTRLRRLAGRRITKDGVLVIRAQRFRSQERNRADAVRRLVALLQQAARPPARRRKTQPSAAARRQRREEKARRSRVKALRTRPAPD
jgi:ribosome-associated protein